MNHTYYRDSQVVKPIRLDQVEVRAVFTTRSSSLALYDQRTNRLLMKWNGARFQMAVRKNELDPSNLVESAYYAYIDSQTIVRDGKRLYKGAEDA